MYDLPSNTMIAYTANPLFNEMNFGHLPVSLLKKEIEAFKPNRGSYVHPETDALTFYFLNHAFHLLKNKYGQLDKMDADAVKVAESHIRMTNQIAKRLFFYSVIIAVEEARFIPSQDDQFFGFLKNSYGEDFHNYAQKRFSGNFTDFGNLDMTCGDYSAAMISVFAFGKWQPGFGGKGWVPIASLVSQCIQGSISFEQFADQAFSLCHNNGSMFNKGHMYHCYSNFIYTILDIQDSGQIPQWIGSNLNSQYVTKDLKDVYTIMAKMFPEEMGGPVNKALISNSEKKRAAKQAQQAKQNQAMWNNWNAPQNVAQQKQNAAVSKSNALNNLLMGGKGP